MVNFLESNLDSEIDADVIIIHGEPWVDILDLKEKAGFDLYLNHWFTYTFQAL